jgi:hypothetical protein
MRQSGDSLRRRYYETRKRYEADPARHRVDALEAARRMIADGLSWEGDAADAMRHFGAEVLDAVIAHLIKRTRDLADRGLSFQHLALLSDTCEILGREAIPAILAFYRANEEGEMSAYRAAAIGHLIDLDDGAHAELIRQELGRGLAEKQFDYKGTFPMLDLTVRWGPERLADRLWELVRDPGKKVRDAVVPVVARFGDEAVRPRAVEMLESTRKPDLRVTAAELLAALGTPAALDALEARRDVEPSEDVRDAIMRALDAAGRPAASSDRAANLARVADALKAPVAPWADEAKLPELRDRDGRLLGPEATRYLLYRQSRSKEIAPDIEARSLYDRVDPASGADFAAALLGNYISSGNPPTGRWTLAVVGRLGGARIVPALVRGIDEWVKANRLSIAESAVQSLALVGDESTLAALDAVARRYRAKPKNIGQAAQDALRAAADRLGITLDELGDRIVPTLGFEPGKPRIIEAGGKRIEAAIGPDFKLRYRETASGKAVKSLPSSVSKEVKAEFKDLAAQLREAARAQTARLEDQLVRQRRWPVARWRELFLGCPVLVPFAVRLVWGHYDEPGRLDATFRALEDRTMTDAASDPYELPETGSVGIVHPLELDDATRTAWRAHLADYEVEPPFFQLDRPVVRVPEDQREARFLRAARGTKLDALTFRGRAERRGWRRGPVVDNGDVRAYVRKSPAGVDAVLALEGMHVQPGQGRETTLQDVGFFRAGEWTGLYYGPLPRDESDPRLIPLGEVPPIIYSEVVSDLSAIAGQAADDADSEDV